MDTPMCLGKAPKGHPDYLKSEEEQTEVSVDLQRLPRLSKNLKRSNRGIRGSPEVSQITQKSEVGFQGYPWISKG